MNGQFGGFLESDKSVKIICLHLRGLVLVV